MNSNPYQSPENTEEPTQSGVKIGRVCRIPFLSMVALGSCFGFAIGTVYGVGTFIVSLFVDIDMNLPDELGSHEIRGVLLGTVMLIVLPLYFTILAAILSIPAYWPFQLALRCMGRWIRIEGAVESRSELARED